MSITEPEWQAITLSLKVAALAVALSLPLAIAVGYWLAHRRFWGKVFVETFVNLPLVLPPVVTGYLLLVLFGTQGVLGRFLNDTLGLRLVFDWKGAALASAVVGFPLMVRSVRLGFAAVDPHLENAAKTLGAPPLRVFFRVSLPLAWPGVLAGAVLGFARSLGEFGATLMIAGSIAGETRTIPLFVYHLLESPDGPAAARRIIVLSILIAAAALLLSELIERKTTRHRDPRSSPS
ncbi:MAG: molybdate ABC transporter permease subunit [Planctomycetota bacterium]